jgi:hypothetical protein
VKVLVGSSSSSSSPSVVVVCFRNVDIYVEELAEGAACLGGA